MKTAFSCLRFFAVRLSSWLVPAARVPAALAALTLGFAAHALPFTPAQETSVRAVVEGQLAALARDDAVKAFSFAAPNVRQAVGSPAAFLAMVRLGYPAIYRPASVAFLKPEGKEGQAIQRVQMVDASGDAWLAIYSLQLQKDRSWRITGCNVVPSKARMA